MATRASKEQITREPGYLYYLGKDGYVWKTPMRGKKGKKERAGKEKIDRKPGLYFVDKAGYVGYIPRGAGKKKKMTATVTKFNVKIGGGKTVKSKLLKKAYKKI